MFTSLPPCTVCFHYVDGSIISTASSSHKVALATVRGPAHLVLRGERVALNALAECTSVATTASRAVAIAKSSATGKVIKVAGTRKTMPGARLVQKYGMIVGGMDPHRFDLSSMVMIKDNHIKACGSIIDAVNKVRHVAGFTLRIDVEAQNEKDALDACEAGADIVMLDNFQLPELERVAAVLKQRWPGVTVEASGGVNLESLKSFCVPGVDVVSFSVNRHATGVDMSLKIDG